MIRTVSLCRILWGCWGIQSLYFPFLFPVQWKGNFRAAESNVQSIWFLHFLCLGKVFKPYCIRIMLFSTKSALLLTMAKHWVFNPCYYPIPLCNLPDKSKKSILLVDPSYPSWEIKRWKNPPWDAVEFEGRKLNTCQWERKKIPRNLRTEL